MIKEIEDAMINQIKDLGVFKKVAPYSGDIEDVLTKVRLWPSAFVVYTGSMVIEETNATYEKEMFFTVLVCAKDLRGEVEARRETQGLYELLEAIHSKLAGKTGEELGLSGLKYIEPREDRLIYMDKGRVIFGFEFQANVRIWR